MIVWRGPRYRPRARDLSLFDRIQLAVAGALERLVKALRGDDGHASIDATEPNRVVATNCYFKNEWPTTLSDIGAAIDRGNIACVRCRAPLVRDGNQWRCARWN